MFDGERDLGGGLVLRGVATRPAVGLLSELEALRYLQVKPPHTKTETGETATIEIGIRNRTDVRIVTFR